MNDPITLSQAVGRFLSEFRNSHGLTLDQIARTARDFGAKWSPSSVRNIENGQAVTSLQNLLSLGLALNELTNKQLTLSDLLGDAEVVEGPTGLDLPVYRSWIDRALSGSPLVFEDIGTDLYGAVDLAADTLEPFLNRIQKISSEVPAGVKLGELRNIQNRPVTLAEERAAQKVGISALSLQIWAQSLWGQSLEEEASARADARSKITAKPVTAQTRGAMTRQLLKELHEATTASRHGSPA